jgi:predicted esterase
MRLSGPRRSHAAFAHVALVVAAATWPARSLAQAPAPRAENADAARRDLWSRGDARFLRQWLVAGPVAGSLGQDSSAPADMGALKPAPGAAFTTGAGEDLHWLPHTSWQDTVNLAEATGARLFRGRSAPTEVAFAAAVLKREREGDAVLSVGSDGGVRVWVNGRLVHASRSERLFRFDDEQVPVQLVKGDNPLLLQLEHRTGPWSLAVRVLEPGTLFQPRTEIVPSLAGGPPGKLSVRTDDRARVSPSAAAPVEVAVIAGGGRVMARQVVQRGELASFDPAQWPDGAYDVRLLTRASSGHTATTYLPWYKGDAYAAAHKRMEQASLGDDAESPTRRMLAELSRQRLEDLAGEPDDGWRAIHAPLMELEELDQARRGGPGPVRPSGFVRLAYVSDVDGSAQFCRAYLPAHYSASRRWPLMEVLHGYNPPNPPYVGWWSIDSRHERVAESRDVIVLEPHARGNAQYLGIGEQDVLRCLELAKQRLSVDEDRVYLYGESMGGSGTWLVASRHPDLFAAAAPVYGGWDFRIQKDRGFDNPRASWLPERFVQEAHSSFAGAEGLLNLPLFVTHGDADQTVSVEFSRHVVAMLQRWGYDVRYEEMPGWGHEELETRERRIDWLLEHRRVAAPRRVRLRATDLGGGSAYWVRVLSWEEPLRPMVVDAEVVEPGLVRLDTDNVATLSLALPPALRGAGGVLRVVWNGREREVRSSADGSTSLSSDAEPATAATPMLKRPGLEGRLSSFITTPFAIVVGTASADPQMRQLCRAKAEEFARRWQAWQHVTPRLLEDRAVTAADEERYSLLLFGGADANLVSRRLMPGLPVTVAEDGVTVDGRRLSATDAVLQLIYPNPSRPERYLLLVAGTSAAGMHFWDPSALWHPALGHPTMMFDWTIRDGRRVVLEKGLGPQRGWVASGIFDRHWRRDDRWVFTGDEALRAASPLRHAPAAGFAATPAALDSFVGRYEIFPGYFMRVVRDGKMLAASLPGLPAAPLIAESEAEFAWAVNSASFLFERDGAGEVSGVVINNDGAVVNAPRKP